MDPNSNEISLGNAQSQQVPINILRVVATEESLDQWHAQSLGVPYDKYLR